ncbi:unnamed protein product [Amoebophrya sp. A25]|nr:unnamed protein product [Amoebophrya sp. A25]|eukprot:GSA25T00005002001.1
MADQKQNFALTNKDVPDEEGRLITPGSLERGQQGSSPSDDRDDDRQTLLKRAAERIGIGQGMGIGQDGAGNGIWGFARLKEKMRGAFARTKKLKVVGFSFVIILALFVGRQCWFSPDPFNPTPLPSALGETVESAQTVASSFVEAALPIAKDQEADAAPTSKLDGNAKSIRNMFSPRDYGVKVQVETLGTRLDALEGRLEKMFMTKEDAEFKMEEVSKALGEKMETNKAAATVEISNAVNELRRDLAKEIADQGTSINGKVQKTTSVISSQVTQLESSFAKASGKSKTMLDSLLIEDTKSDNGRVAQVLSQILQQGKLRPTLENMVAAEVQSIRQATPQQWLELPPVSLAGKTFAHAMMAFIVSIVKYPSAATNLCLKMDDLIGSLERSLPAPGDSSQALPMDDIKEKRVNAMYAMKASRDLLIRQPIEDTSESTAEALRETISQLIQLWPLHHDEKGAHAKNERLAVKADLCDGPDSFPARIYPAANDATAMAMACNGFSRKSQDTTKHGEPWPIVFFHDGDNWLETVRAGQTVQQTVDEQFSNLPKSETETHKVMEEFLQRTKSAFTSASRFSCEKVLASLRTVQQQRGENEVANAGTTSILLYESIRQVITHDASTHSHDEAKWPSVEELVGSSKKFCEETLFGNDDFIFKLSSEVRARQPPSIRKFACDFLIKEVVEEYAPRLVGPGDLQSLSNLNVFPSERFPILPRII